MGNYVSLVSTGSASASLGLMSAWQTHLIPRAQGPATAAPSHPESALRMLLLSLILSAAEVGQNVNAGEPKGVAMGMQGDRSIFLPRNSDPMSDKGNAEGSGKNRREPGKG